MFPQLKHRDRLPCRSPSSCRARRISQRFAALPAFGLAAALTAQAPPPSVVINEFVYDNAGVDDREFVELVNPLGVPVDISGWQLLAEDAMGPNAGYTIPANTTMTPGAFYVLGSGLVAGVHQVVGTTDLWDNDTASLTLVDDQGIVVDTLVYESFRGLWNLALAEGEGLWGEHVSTPGLESSWSRCPDGYDIDNNGRDFWPLPATPGAGNAMNTPVPYVRDFDAMAPGSTLPEWSSSTVAPRVIDPTVPGPHNPVAIPSSPQGGLAVAFGDSSGAGNTNTLTAPVGPGQSFAAWVWFDASPAPVGQPRGWSVGFGGTSGVYELPDPSGTLGTTSNGNAGVSWTYQVIGSTATLYLIDHNDGGWGPGAASPAVVAGQVSIQPGVNDGWQQLRLHQLGTGTIGHFGGGPTSLDWVVPPGNSACCPIRPVPCCSVPCIQSSPGNCQTGREVQIRNNFHYSSARGLPLIVDDLDVRGSNADVGHTGLSAPNSGGTTPILIPTSPPVTGNLQLRIRAYQLLPGGVSFLLGGFSTNQVPITGLPGPAMSPSVLSVLLLGDTSGTASLGMAIPSSPGFIGLPVSWQVFDYDAALPHPIPLASSNVMTTVIGAF